MNDGFSQGRLVGGGGFDAGAALEAQASANRFWQRKEALEVALRARAGTAVPVAQLVEDATALLAYLSASHDAPKAN